MRAFTRKVRSALIQHGERHILYGPLMMSLGFRTRFVSIAHPGHIGKSAYSFRKRLQLAARSLMTYTDMPILILIRCGALMTVGSLAYFLAVIAGYLFHGRQLADGITIAISLLCLLTGMTTFSLGIIGGYIFQIYQEVLSRPRYLIQDSVNLDATFGDNTVPDIPEYNSTHIHSGPAGNPKKLRAPEETVP